MKGRAKNPIAHRHRSCITHVPGLLYLVILRGTCVSCDEPQGEGQVEVSKATPSRTVLFCTVLHCIVLYRIAMYMYCTISCCIVLQRIVLDYITKEVNCTSKVTQTVT